MDNQVKIYFDWSTSKIRYYLLGLKISIDVFVKSVNPKGYGRKVSTITRWNTQKNRKIFKEIIKEINNSEGEK